jgi:hypothetical protein
VTITVRAVNDAPVAKDDSYRLQKDTRLEVSPSGVLKNDSGQVGGSSPPAGSSCPRTLSGRGRTEAVEKRAVKMMAHYE